MAESTILGYGSTAQAMTRSSTPSILLPALVSRRPAGGCVHHPTFGADLDDARAGGRDRWRQTSRGALALVVLLDQFPRHVYRGDARAFDSDETALA